MGFSVLTTYQACYTDFLIPNSTIYPYIVDKAFGIGTCAPLAVFLYALFPFDNIVIPKNRHEIEYTILFDSSDFHATP